MADKKRVLVAMSGGVDSSVAAAMLLSQGYEVEGATMQIWPDICDEDEKISVGCCSLSAVDDARLVAYKLGIRYHVFNFKDIFEQTVIEPFKSEYLKGRTPNPCILCNRIVKFEALLGRALALHFDYIATGHYGLIDVNAETGRYQLKQSKTIAKDQTYALYNLTQHQLAHLLLPIGNLTKPEVREYAEKIGLPVFDKPDSQEICFVKDNDYGGFIERSGAKIVKGNFVDKEGNVLGKHKGIVHYTIGQRKGLGISFSEPHFVININADTNEVVLGKSEDTLSSELIAGDLNFISIDGIKEEMRATAKIRYSAPQAACTVFPLEGGRIRVVFDLPVRAITKGQSVVLYNEDGVIGGGVIE